MLWEIFISLQCTARTGNANMEITTCCSDGLLWAVQGLVKVQNQKGAGRFVFNCARKGWAAGVLDWGELDPESSSQSSFNDAALQTAEGFSGSQILQTDTIRQCKVNAWLLLSTVLFTVHIPKYMKAEFLFSDRVVTFVHHLYSLYFFYLYSLEICHYR